MSKGQGAPTEKTGKPTEAATQKGKGAGAPVADGCTSVGCKASAKQFSFCAEHYEHFKFGLIKKSGQPVPDYEKKFGHYQAFVARQRGQKAA